MSRQASGYGVFRGTNFGVLISGYDCISAVLRRCSIVREKWHHSRVGLGRGGSRGGGAELMFTKKRNIPRGIGRALEVPGVRS